MEHVASHLKAYASNNTEFRALIGEPRMGKVSICFQKYSNCSNRCIRFIFIVQLGI